MKRSILVASLAVLALAAAGVAYRYSNSKPPDPPPPVAPPWFTDITADSGITFVHDAGELDRYWMPQINGSGVAIFDYDGDGLNDLYFLTLGGPDSKSINRLYHNEGGGRFRDATEGSGLGIPGNNTGVIAGDVDNDGRPDLIVTQYSDVRLFRNLGGGKFQDVTAESGLKNPLWGTSANLVDFDRDGWLDLIIVNYIDYDASRKCPNPAGQPDYCGPHIFRDTVSKLFRNLGRPANAEPGQPRYQDVTLAAGLAAAPGPGLGVYCADFTGDGWPDFFIANDLKANHLWVNQKNGTFREEAFVRGIALNSMGQALSGMGVAAGDVDNDGHLDIYVTHLNNEKNTLWVQGRRGAFTDRTVASGLLAAGWRGTGWGTLFADFDCDGSLDLAVANGRVSRNTGESYPPLGSHFEAYGERNQLFRNTGDGKFADISEANPDFCGLPNLGRGLAAGDLDGDGAIDLVLTVIHGPARVFRNVAPNRGHWLRIRALDPRLSRDAYGAEVRVRAGNRRWLRVVNPGDSFQSCSDPHIHCGLGELARYDAVTIRWPDGLLEEFPGGAADRTFTLRRGEGQPQKADY